MAPRAAGAPGHQQPTGGDDLLNSEVSPPLSALGEPYHALGSVVRCSQSVVFVAPTCTSSDDALKLDR